MKTVAYFKVLVFMLLASSVNGQYLEDFGISERGILIGPCPGGISTSCVSFNFMGVNWDVNGDLSGIDGTEDFAKSNAVNRFEFHGDIDEEVCWESPILDVSTVGSSSFSVDLTWTSHDNSDYIDVEYQLDGGIWVQVPNQIGGGSHTIDFTSSGNNGSMTVTSASEPPLFGNTLSVRVCADTNTSSDNTTLDNVSVPEAGTIVLPVKWAEFKARATSEGNQLNWATFSEVDNEKFEIERSTNGSLEFEKIGTVEGAGTTTKTSRYEFLDRDLTTATTYYRIKQVDFDGNFEYSQVVVVQRSMKEKLRFTPNPFSTQLLMSGNQVDLEQGTTIRMYNNQGRLVLEKEITEYNISDPIETAHLTAGMYTIQYSNGELVRLVKF